MATVFDKKQNIEKTYGKVFTLILEKCNRVFFPMSNARVELEKTKSIRYSTAQNKNVENRD